MLYYKKVCYIAHPNLLDAQSEDRLQSRTRSHRRVLPNAARQNSLSNLL